MEKITIKGEEFQYELKFHVNDFGELYEWTEFYQGEEVKFVKKFKFFGKLIEKRIPVLKFKVNFDITSAERTKEEVREILERKVTLLHRQEEIDRGELI
jgi:hypothetical protein